ncbi:MAG: ankyrin repeat domain-containing protein, partial [Ottowia sp.]|nr:ankyrin repeat domain-containing protein [Ottowia sp.]
NVETILHAVTGEGEDPPPHVPPQLLSDTAVFSSRRRAMQFAAACVLLFISACVLVYRLGILERPQPAPARTVQGSVDDALRDVDINKRDANGQTPLMLAAEAGDIERVRRLIAVGAKLDDADKQGNTALSLAQAAGHKDIVKMLRSAGARRTPPQPAAKTPPPQKRQ